MINQLETIFRQSHSGIIESFKQIREDQKRPLLLLMNGKGQKAGEE
jgi:hypothetical protein